MLPDSDITWNARRLSRSLEGERRLCCFVNAMADPDFEARDDYYEQLVADNIEENIEKVTNDLREALEGFDVKEPDHGIQDTFYRASSKTLEHTDHTLNQASKIAIEYESIIGKDGLKNAIQHLEDSKIILRIFNRWFSGELSPSMFLQQIEDAKSDLNYSSSPDYKQSTQYAKRLAQSVNDQLQTGYNDIHDWAQLEIDDKLLLLAQVSKQHLGVLGFIDQMDAKTGEYAEIIKSITEDLDESGLKNNIFAKDTEKIIEENDYFFNRIKWASPLEMYKGVKMWYEAMKRSYEQYSDKRAIEFAEKISKASGMLPFKFLKDTEDILKEDVNKKQKEIRNNYLEFYKSDGPTYLKVFGNGGLYEKATDDQRKLALLLYAAENGWLYGIESGTINTPLGGKIILSQLIGDGPDSVSFFEELQAMNFDGAKKREERGYNRVKSLESQDRIQEELQKAIHEVDLPSIIGIARRANEKGLDGSTNERSMVAILEGIHDPETGPLIRRAISKEWLDNVAKVNTADATIGLGHFKTDRDAIYRYVKQYDKMGGHNGLQYAGNSGKAVWLARKKLIAADPSLKKNKDKLQRKIAHLLASHDVEVGGKYFSIWHPDFAFYRHSKGIAEFDAPNHKPETDFDYSKEISSQILRSSKIYSRMLPTNNEGRLEREYGDQAKAFLAKIIKTRDSRLELAKKGKISKDEYLEMMLHLRKNMGEWVAKNLQNSYGTQFASMSDPSKTNELLLKTLLDKGIVNAEVLLQNLFEDNATKVTETYLRKQGLLNLREFARKYSKEKELEKYLNKMSADKRNALSSTFTW